MTLMTALEIADNYPENISIATFRDGNNGLFGGIIYRMKNGQIHKTLLSHSEGVHLNRKEVKKELHELMQEIKQKYENSSKPA